MHTLDTKIRTRLSEYKCIQRLKQQVEFLAENNLCQRSSETPVAEDRFSSDAAQKSESEF